MVAKIFDQEAQEVRKDTQKAKTLAPANFLFSAPKICVKTPKISEKMPRICTGLDILARSTG